MFKARVRHGGASLLLLITGITSPLLSQTVSNPNRAASSTASDAAAVQAMNTVLAQSGGATEWQSIRSVEEKFSVLEADGKTTHIRLLLDDWTTSATRYRRKTEGQRQPSMDHNGALAFAVNTGFSQAMMPELDQARVLVDRLPAAAAEVILTSPEYVVKITKSEPCDAGDVCVDVFRISNSPLPMTPEQQWKISMSTGLPVAIRYRLPVIGSGPAWVWSNTYMLHYAAEEGLTIPVSIMTVFGRKRETWTFVSLKKNPGFNVSLFDQEAAQ